jgi:hypothetical protein
MAFEPRQGPDLHIETRLSLRELALDALEACVESSIAPCRKRLDFDEEGNWLDWQDGILDVGFAIEIGQCDPRFFD